MPILIHGGRGLPPIAAASRALVDRYPDAQLIIAHAGIADLATLAAASPGAGVFFDTSAWSAVDLLDFYRLVPPEQVVYASDYPYGRQPNSLLLALRTARIAGFSDDEVRNMLAGNANRIANGERAAGAVEPRGRDEFTQPMVLARIHQYLSMATPLLWTRQPDTIGVLGLAINAAPSATATPRGRPDPRAARSRRASSGAGCPSRGRGATASKRRAPPSARCTSPTSALDSLRAPDVNGARQRRRRGVGRRSPRPCARTSA